MTNIFDYELPKPDSEHFKTLLKEKNVEIKTVVSNALKTPQTFVDKKDEWVVVLKGCAKLEINGIVHKLKSGDTLFIAANTKHTLLKTKKVVVWLSVYIG
ncbi:cupin domain-containing protein [Sulfurimonas autotrophica]|uniref:Phosphoribosylaminoimidazole carboxylase ATPase subunit n=1 Tax=Sulfurimonas autotrophica (strain ATCC BAA-671 / DSM 16294 / JCM 11897 / OK10) TaxID=563040 RepID=E0US44_SULAO|nr:cupin domain-containing protein [Sulfurimonas autotrophica]ADN09067.1 phosphoribosylaminoimidazole carboxylase ATPase subunit [Sulfurimonas autotrophica DSM 16294]